MEKHMHFCMWHPATVISHEWIQLLTGGITAPAGRSLPLTQRALSEPPQLCICLSRVTLICFLLDHMFLTHCSPEMPVLLLKPDAAFNCDRGEHLVMVNLQNNANNYFLEKNNNDAFPKPNVF